MIRSLCILAVSLLCSATLTAAEGWMTDLDEARKLALQEKKPLLVNFTGSDWCGYCIKLHDEVFTTKEFKDFARKCVLVELDYPSKKPQPEEVKARNKEIKAKFGVRGFPTVLLIDAESGDAYGRVTGYPPGSGPKAYVQKLSAFAVAPNGSASPAAAVPPKDYIVYGAHEGKKSSELKVVGIEKKVFPDSWIVGWSAGQSIVYDPRLTPGRYRVSAFIFPYGFGSLTLRVGDGPLNRRSIPASRGLYKSYELKMGEVDIHGPQSQLILAFEHSSSAPVSFGLIKVQVAKVGPPTPVSSVKSPVEAAAAKVASEKLQAAEKEAASLRARLIGSKWNWYPSHDFSGQAYPMTFHGEKELTLPWNLSTPYKVIDGRTIDVYYNDTSFWRLNLSDDLGSFKTDMTVGMKQPKSGKLLSAPASASVGK